MILNRPYHGAPITPIFRGAGGSWGTELVAWSRVSILALARMLGRVGGGPESFLSDKYAGD